VPAILMGKDTNRAGKPYSSDAVEYEQFTTPGGLLLHAAVVATAQGGAERGEQAAKTAVKAILDHLKASSETDPPTLLRSAFANANRLVYTYREAQPDANAPTGNKGATLAVALLVDGKKLFVASLGQCRVYLYQHKETRLIQLTLDHTFANVMAQQGRMSVQAARSTHQADQIVKSLGVPLDVVADTGFYINTMEFDRAADLGRQGYLLSPGDSVIVVSEGLAERSKTTREPLLSEPEIVTAITTLPTSDAVRAIIDGAVTRQPQESLSVAVLQPEFRYRPANGKGGNRRAALVAAVLLFALVAAFAVAALNTSRQEPPINVETGEANRIAFIETAIQATVNSFSPTPSETPTITPTDTPTPTVTPTYTPRPTLVEMEIGAWFQNSANDTARHVLLEGAEVETGADYYVVAVNHNPVQLISDANIYAQPNTRFRFHTVSEAELRLDFFTGNMLVTTGAYPVANVELGDRPGWLFSVSGSSMAMNFMSETLLAVDCFEGECTYETPRPDDDTRTIPEGEQVIIDFSTGEEHSSGQIPSRDAVYYQGILLNTLGGSNDFQTYVSDYLPTPTPTRIPPTRTPPPPTATFDIPNVPTVPTECGLYGC
jgi:serine/threonine protein phosphatase PrpC